MNAIRRSWLALLLALASGNAVCSWTIRTKMRRHNLTIEGQNMRFIVARSVSLICLLIGVGSGALSAAATDSVEYSLASVDAGYEVQQSAPTVAKFRSLLDSLARKSGLTHRKIGDMVANVHNSLKTKYGVKVTLLDYMREVDAGMPSQPTNVKLETVLALVGVQLTR